MALLKDKVRLLLKARIRQLIDSGSNVWVVKYLQHYVSSKQGCETTTK